MPAKLFDGVSCTDGVNAKKQTKEQARQNSAKLAKAMGASEKCVKMNKQQTSSKTTAGGGSARVSILGGLGGSGKMAFNFVSAQSKADAENRSSGCGSMIIDQTEIFDAVRNMTIGNPARTIWAMCHFKSGLHPFFCISLHFPDLSVISA